MAYQKDSSTLTLFQQWALLYFHQNPDQVVTGYELLKECCITAMEDNFSKDTVTSGLRELEQMRLIKSIYEELPDVDDPELQVKYISSVDGLIYTKKMLKPILNSLNREDFRQLIRQLDDKRSVAALENIMNASITDTQQTSIKKITAFGLGNISGLARILAVIEKSIPHIGL